MNDFKTIITHLKIEFKNPLPGVDTQLRMSPSIRNQGIRDLKFDEKSRDSGVLILLYPKNEITHLVFIKRASSGGPHSGQISLPGGKYETVDKDLIETALRETEEEIGVKQNDIVVIGSLTSLFIPVSNMQVLPVVGYINYCPEFINEVTEVEETVEISLYDFADKKNSSVKTLIIREFEIIAPCYMANGHMIWGATAMIMSEFIELISRAGIISPSSIQA